MYDWQKKLLTDINSNGRIYIELPRGIGKRNKKLTREEYKQKLITYLGHKYIDEDRPLTDLELDEGYENRYTLELMIDEWIEQKKEIYE